MFKYIPFAQYSPDQPLMKDPGYGVKGFTATATNVVPKDAQGSSVTYGPFPSLNAYSNALSARCQGAIGVVGSNDNAYIFSGDAAKLYLLTVASTSWVDVSQALAAYNVNADDYWFFCNYSDRIIATQPNFAVQSYLIGSSTVFADLSATAPTAKYCAVVKDFLMLANTTDGVSGTRNQRIWWSAVGDSTDFPTPGTVAAAQVQSDYQDIPGDFGQITGLVANVGHYDAAVFFERAIYVLSYAAPPVIFDIKPAVGARGTYAPKSIVKEGSLVFYYGENGFHSFDGATATPIGVNRVDAKIQDEVAAANISRIIGISDPASKCIIWAYPGLSSQNGVPNKALAYNWAIDKWSSLDFGSNIEMLLRAPTFGFSLDNLDALYPNLDLMPGSMDSPVWSGAGILLAAFDGSHKLDYLDGMALTPTIETPEFQVSDGQIPLDTRGYVRDARPDFQGRDAAVTVQIGARENFNADLAYGPVVATDANGSCPQRIGGRYFTAKLGVTSGTWTHLLGIEVDLVKQGRR